MEKKKPGFERGLLTALIGVCIIFFGAYTGYPIIRLSGVIVSCGGMVAMGKRLYERIREKARSKKVLDY